MGSMPAVNPDYNHPLISERSIDQPRALKVIYLGAGISGIDAAIQFPKFVPNLDLVVYEKNYDIGGTWYENRYPGAACDIPAHSYQASFESSTEWSQFYAGASEILSYWRRVVEKYGIRKYMRFRHKAIEARWNESTSKWHVKLEKLDTGEIIEDSSDVLVTGIGVLNEWKWPDIKGLHDFKGDLLHSANWSSTFSAKDKTVAVIGAGSSGIQIVPALQKQVKHMDHYIRGRTWIASTFAAELVKARKGEDGNFDYTEEEKHAWRKDPKSYIQYRKDLEVGIQGGFIVTHRGSKEHAGAWKQFDQEMRKKMTKKPDVSAALIPEFPPLCKRLTPGPGYLESLMSDNVTVIQQSIEHIDATGIVAADGKHRPVDAIICATGFDPSFQGRFPIIGRGGQNLQDRYRKRPESYLSVCTDGFPNHFMSLGPNAGLGNGNLLIVIEAIQLYIGQILRKLAAENVRTIEPKRQAVLNFTDYCDAFFKRTFFSAECGSWYKTAPPGATAEERKRGRVTALWPGSSLHAVRALERVRFEDFEMTLSEENEFAWFGDGWTVAERTMDVEGLSWYLNETRFLHEELSREDGNRVNGGVNETTHGDGQGQVDGPVKVDGREEEPVAEVKG